MTSRTVGVLSASVFLITLAGCCCGMGNKEAEAEARAEEVFAAIRANDVEALRATFNPWMAEHHSAKRVSTRLSNYPELTGHTSVLLTKSACTDWSCQFDCTLEPGSAPCEIDLTISSDWELENLYVRGERVLPD